MTHVVIGHPVVCDNRELFIEAMPRSGTRGTYRWHVAVNNPTDKPVRARFRQGMDLPGLKLRPRQLTIRAGGHTVLAK